MKSRLVGLVAISVLAGCGPVTEDDILVVTASVVPDTVMRGESGEVLVTLVNPTLYTVEVDRGSECDPFSYQIFDTTGARVAGWGPEQWCFTGFTAYAGSTFRLGPLGSITSTLPLALSTIASASDTSSQPFPAGTYQIRGFCLCARRASSPPRALEVLAPVNLR